MTHKQEVHHVTNKQEVHPLSLSASVAQVCEHAKMCEKMTIPSGHDGALEESQPPTRGTGRVSLTKLRDSLEGVPTLSLGAARRPGAGRCLPCDLGWGGRSLTPFVQLAGA